MRHVFFGLVLGFPLFAAPTPDTFVNAFNEYYAGQRPLPRAGNEHYVFVAGFLNEGIPGYFGENIRELKKLGVPAARISVVKPKSGKTFEENSTILKRGLIEILKEKTDRAVIFAHSRGAIDALAFALQNPDYIRDQVTAIFLVQGAFGGSGIADYIRGTGHALDDSMPQPYRTFFYLTGRTEKLLDPCIERGLTALTREKAREFWKALLRDHADAIPVVSEKAYYIVGKEKPSDVAPVIRANAYYLHTYYGENDGMVTAADQTLSGIGTTLAVVKADHSDLTNGSGLSNSPRKLREALMRAIVTVVD